MKICGLCRGLFYKVGVMESGLKSTCFCPGSSIIESGSTTKVSLATLPRNQNDACTASCDLFSSVNDSQFEKLSSELKHIIPRLHDRANIELARPANT